MTYSASGTMGQGFGADRPSGPTGAEPGGAPARGYCSSWGSKKRWAPLELGAMIGGFVVFWPLGLVALGLKLTKGEMWRGASEGTMPWTGWLGKQPSMPGAGSFKGFGFGNFAGAGSSGNAAFDAYKREQLARLEEERRKLEDEQRAFRDYMQRLNEAKDKEEFDRFMAERAAAAKPVNNTDM